MSQLFKYSVNEKYFTDFIIKYCSNVKNNEFVFSLVSYKKAVYDNKIKELIDTIKPCYHKSKQFYLERNINYKNFLTILRQVCSNLSISYSSKILYNKSKYNINYTIFLNNHDISSNDVEDISSNVVFN